MFRLYVTDRINASKAELARPTHTRQLPRLQAHIGDFGESSGTLKTQSAALERQLPEESAEWERIRRERERAEMERQRSQGWGFSYMIPCRRHEVRKSLP